MNIDITQIIVSAIGLIGLILTGIVSPSLRSWLKSKFTAEQWDTIYNYAVAAVQAAEIIIGAGKGEEKFAWAKEYIEAQCKAHGIKIDMDTVQVAIENAWKDLGLDHSNEQEKVA